MPTKQGGEIDCKKLGKGASVYIKASCKNCQLDELCKFFLWYVTERDGVRRAERTLSANKGSSYFPNMMTLEHVTYVVWPTENHFDQ